MNPAWLPALGLPFVAGFFLAAGLSGRRASFNVALGLGLGFGLTSLTAYPCLAANGLAGHGFAWIELTLAALLFGLYLLRHRHGKPDSAGPPWLKTDYWLLTVLGLTALMAGYVFLRVSLTYHHGTWDAWNNWNLIPRFIFRATEHWRDRHAYAHTLAGHPYDYPLLPALSVARIWKWLSMEAPAGPILIAASFTLATASLLYFVLADLTDRRQGFLAAALLIGTPNYINIATTQYADVPLSFFILAAPALFCLAWKDQGRSRSLLILAGLTAGLAAWTKNEGLLFLLAFCLARITVSVVKRRPGLIGEALPFLLGMLAPALVWLHYKLTLALPSHFSNSLPVMLNHLFDLTRHLKSFSYMISAMGPLIALAVYLLLLGARPGALKQTGVLTGLLTCVLVLLGYHLMFVCMNPDDRWSLALSLNLNWERIILHIWPLFIFTFFQIAASPEIEAIPTTEAREI